MVNHPPFRQVLIAGLLLAAIGWAGLGYCIFFTLPTLAPRWFFFFFLVIAICGLVLPVLSFFHRRFPTNPAADQTVIIRQTLWWGIFSGLIVWLQLGRVLTSNRTIFLAVGFIIMEMLLRLLETSRWKPGLEDDAVKTSSRKKHRFEKISQENPKKNRVEGRRSPDLSNQNGDTEYQSSENSNFESNEFD